MSKPTYSIPPFCLPPSGILEQIIECPPPPQTNPYRQKSCKEAQNENEIQGHQGAMSLYRTQHEVRKFDAQLHALKILSLLYNMIEQYCPAHIVQLSTNNIVQPDRESGVTAQNNIVDSCEQCGQLNNVQACFQQYCNVLLLQLTL